MFLGDVQLPCEIIEETNTFIRCQTPIFEEAPESPHEVKLISNKVELSCEECLFEPKQENTFIIFTSWASRSIEDGSLSLNIAGLFSPLEEMADAEVP